MIRDDIESAFPTHGSMGECVQQGMSLRDYFAAKALPIMWDAYDKGYCVMTHSDGFDNDELAKGAYQIADAMMKARDA